MGVVYELMNTLDSLKSEHGLSEIKSVTVGLGEASLVVPKYLTDCWEAATSMDGPYKGVKLKINLIEAMGRCGKCDFIYPIVRNDRHCPKCHSDSFTLVDGEQIEISTIEAA